MQVEKRESTRRKGDTLIYETLHFNRTLIKVLEGKKGNLNKILYRLHRLSMKLGRRRRDGNVGKAFYESLELIARLLLEMGLIEQLPRKVYLRKMFGQKLERFPVGTRIVGWELQPPKSHQNYLIYLDNGNIFRTSAVLDFGDDYLRTFNSTYLFEIVEESYIGRVKSGNAFTH
jgi:hypothetical protein